MISPRQLSRFFVLLIGYLLLTISACSSPQPAAPTAAPAISSGSVEDTSSPATAVPVATEETASTAVSTPQPNQSRSATQMRSYALDAVKLMSVVDLSQSQPLQAGVTVTGRITPNALAIPYTYTAQAGDVLLAELLLPDLPDADMQTIRPAILIADGAGNEIGYVRGGQDFVNMSERRSIAQAGFITPSSGDYTILATLDGHHDPAQNPVYEADFTLTVTPALSLAVNEAHEATRDSTERHVYAVTTAVGEFDIIYEEIAGEPPGQYAINVYRLGTPADGMALASSMAASYPFNFTVPFRDNAYASIAERMGLEKLTYIIAIASAVTSGQEETAYTSNYRLTVAQQEPATAEETTATASATAALGPIAGDETWETRLNHTMRVQFQIPAGWEVASGNNTFYGRDSASLEMSFADYPYEGSPPFVDAAGACQGLTQGITAAAFGTGTGEVVSVNGHDVCVISHPQSGEPYRAIIKYPEPVELTGTIGPRGIWNFLNIEIEPADYFWPIVESITFPDEPSAHLYASGVLDILKAHYYFRDQLDWAALEAGLDARLENDSSLDDAYEALRWLIEEIAAAVNHHHMFLRTPDQVQKALRGEQQQVGLQTAGGVITLVWPDSPATLAGLQMGDEIITVNGDPFAEANFNSDRFDLVVRRDGEQFAVTLVSQTVSYILPPRGQHLGDVAYLETFGIFGADLPLLQAYATDVQATIKELNSASTCGWILDVRRNSGGSIHAIMAGIAPLVGEGELYRIRGNDGHEDITFYENGRVFGVGTSEFPAMVDTPYELRSPNPPLAVLVSRGTASAGEVSAIIVSGRPNSRARIFGEQTPGLTTPVFDANLYDGGLFYAPIQLVVDLEGRTYLEGVIPDEEVTVVYDSRYGTRDDPVVQAALDWLESEHGCSP